MVANARYDGLKSAESEMNQTPDASGLRAAIEQSDRAKSTAASTREKREVTSNAGKLAKRQTRLQTLMWS